MTTSYKEKTQKHELEGIVQQLPKGLVFFRIRLKLFVVSDMILQRIAQEYRSGQALAVMH